MSNSSGEYINFFFFPRLRAYLELMRPANIVTAFADILAGFAAAGGVIAFEQAAPLITPGGLVWLLGSTFGLYGGGVVFNDVFDAELDTRERPERAIPSGRASKTGAAIAGALLIAFGIYAAFQVTVYSGLLAIFIAAGALIYDAWAKHYAFWGPLFMGICRSGNLLLGCSIVPLALTQVWYLAFLPLIYIGSITLISQGEVHGGSKASGSWALILILLVTAALLLLGLLPSYEIIPALPFAVLFGVMVIPPFLKAAHNPEAPLIKKAVKRGVLSLILLNSTLAAGFSGIELGIVVVLLLPFSMLLAKLFAVT